MRVRMKGQITGTRDGELWPEPGVELTVPDEEGASLCAAGLAVPVESKPERATAPTAEKRSAKKAASSS